MPYRDWLPEAQRERDASSMELDSGTIRRLLQNEGAASEQLFCTVHTVENDRIAVIYSSHPEPELLGGWQITGQGIVGEAVRRVRPFIASDVRMSEYYLAIYPEVRSEMAIPVIAANEVVGIVNFESTIAGFFGAEAHRFEQLALAIARYFELQIPTDGQERLLVPESSLLASDPAQRVDANASAISDALLRSLGTDASLVHRLTPRQFEELVARILEDMGYRVKLTQFQKDGGYDLLAEAEFETGRVLTLVECKKYAPNRRVGVEIVRNLYGVLALGHATNALIATTSLFTRDAVRLQDTIKYNLSLRDYSDLVRWLSRYSSQSKPPE